MNNQTSLMVVTSLLDYVASVNKTKEQIKEKITSLKIKSSRITHDGALIGVNLNRTIEQTITELENINTRLDDHISKFCSTLQQNIEDRKIIDKEQAAILGAAVETLLESTKGGRSGSGNSAFGGMHSDGTPVTRDEIGFRPQPPRPTGLLTKEQIESMPPRPTGLFPTDESRGLDFIGNEHDGSGGGV